MKMWYGILLPSLALFFVSISHTMEAPNAQRINAFRTRNITPKLQQLFVGNGNLEFDFLQDEGVDIDTQDAATGQTFLQIIVLSMRKDLLDNLLARFRPNPFIEDKSGVSALSLAENAKENLRKQQIQLQKQIEKEQAALEKFIKTVDASKATVSDIKKREQKSKRHNKVQENIAKLNAKLAQVNKNLTCFTQFDAYVGSIKFFHLLKKWSILPAVLAAVGSLVNVYAIACFYNLRLQLKKLIDFANDTKKRLLSIDFEMFHDNLLISQNFDIDSTLAKITPTKLRNELSSVITEYDDLVMQAYTCITKSYYYLPSLEFQEKETELVQNLENHCERLKDVVDECVQALSYSRPSKFFGLTALTSLAAFFYHVKADPMKKWGIL